MFVLRCVQNDIFFFDANVSEREMCQKTVEKCKRLCYNKTISVFV